MRNNNLNLLDLSSSISKSINNCNNNRNSNSMRQESNTSSSLYINTANKREIFTMDHPSKLNLSKAIDIHDELMDLLNNLSEKVSLLYSHHEEEFFSTYRTHTLDLQIELRDLKEKIQIAEDFIRNDVQVHALENDLKWFVEESLRLEKQYKLVDEEYGQLVAKQNLLLNAIKIDKIELQQLLRHETIQRTADRLNSRGNHQESLEYYFDELADEELTDDFPANDVSFTQNYSRDFVKKQNLRAIRDDKAYQELTSINQSRSFLELAFEESIRLTFQEDVYLRKSKPHSTYSSSQSLSNVPIQSTTTLSGLGLKYFNDMDRFNCILRLLKNPDVYFEITNIMKQRFLS